VRPRVPEKYNKYQRQVQSFKATGVGQAAGLRHAGSSSWLYRGYRKDREQAWW